MTGPIEEIGRVAGSTVEAFRSAPVLLMLVLMQVMVFGAVLYVAIHRQEATTKQFEQLYMLLQNCVKGTSLTEG
jgi:uncharacterized membrane protein affecting hemolysin expression